MKVNCCLLLVCGLPSSGKTTLTRKLVQQSANRCANQRYVNSSSNCLFDNEIKYYSVSVDDLMSINDQSIAVKQTNVWKQFRRNLLESVKCFISDLLCDNREHNAEIGVNDEITSIYESIRRLNNYGDCDATLHRFVVVVIDDNLYYRSMRYEWYRLAKLFGTGFAQIIIECPLDLALIRNHCKSGEHSVPNDVIIKMNERFEISSMNGFELRTLYVGFNCEISDDINQFIADAIRNPVIDDQTADRNESKRNQSKLANNSSVIHKVDCILREIISSIIDNSTDKIVASKLLSEAKKLILNRLRESSDLLPQSILNELISSSFIGENVRIFFKNLLNKNVVILQT